MLGCHSYGSSGSPTETTASATRIGASSPALPGRYRPVTRTHYRAAVADRQRSLVSLTPVRRRRSRRSRSERAGNPRRRRHLPRIPSAATSRPPCWRRHGRTPAGGTRSPPWGAAPGRVAAARTTRPRDLDPRGPVHPVRAQGRRCDQSSVTTGASSSQPTPMPWCVVVSWSSTTGTAGAAGRGDHVDRADHHQQDAGEHQPRAHGRLDVAPVLARRAPRRTATAPTST